MEGTPFQGRSRVWIWAAVAAVALALVCLGGLRTLRDPDPAPTSPAAPVWAGAPSSAPAPSTTPKASPTPVRTAADLKRVCDQWYFPKAPRVKSSGIQPVAIFSREDKDAGTRQEQTLFDIPKWYTPAKQQAWDPAPAKARQVACVDLLDAGRQVKTCKVDDPRAPQTPMRQGKYRLTLYEVATGRKLAEKSLTGADEKCPFTVLLGADHTIYSAVGDRQLYEALRKHVEK